MCGTNHCQSLSTLNPSQGIYSLPGMLIASLMRTNFPTLQGDNVTELPKIILYYRLSLSTWPLSNNKELLCCFSRVKFGESLTTGSRYALSPHEGGTKVHHYIKVHKFKLLQTRFSYIKVKVVQNLNNGNKN
jgi:hypothetical protein